jgi:serine/threonine protein kinase/HAMP domain-containing protein
MSDQQEAVPRTPTRGHEAEATVIDLNSWIPAEDPALQPRPSQPASGFVARSTPSGTRPAASAPGAGNIALPVGFRLHEYRIDRILGQGGFGIAYAATDVNLDVKVVIKEYLPENFAYRSVDHSVRARDEEDRQFYQAGLENFLVEARTLATFRHPHIVRVARFFEANSTAYMVLEYARGESLKSWRRKHERIPEAEIVALFAPLLNGLEVVHREGYLHRDIKPDNIYVRDADGGLVLLDFGAARQTATEKAETGTVVTPGYAAIEQYAGGGSQGPWTDIYAIGATLYWLVNGKRPVEAPVRLDDPDAQPSARMLARERYSDEFLGAIDWALQLHPGERPQDLEEFRSRLFSSHAGALGLQEALRKHDDDGELQPESWAATLASPRLFWGRCARAGRVMWRPGSWPIAVKMTLAMVLTALAPLAIVAYYNHDRTQAHIAAVELRNLEQLAQSTAGRIAQLIDDSRRLADYVGTDADFVRFLTRPGDAGAQEALRKLEALVKTNADIHFAMVLDRKGAAIIATDAGIMGRDFGLSESFRQAMEGKPHMTGILGAEAGGGGAFYSRPVFAPGGAVVGAVAMRLKADPIGRILSGARDGRHRIPFLLDGDGVVMWHPDERALFRRLAPRWEAPDGPGAGARLERAAAESLNEHALAAALVGARQRGNVSYFSRLTGREEIAGYAPVPGLDWVVAVSESRAYFSAPLQRLFWNVVLSVVLVGAVCLVLALLFARSIVQPIQALTGAAHALKSGDYGKANIAVRTGDEIGQLARTFNVMIDVLRQRERERSGGRAAPGGRDEAHDA